MLADRFGVVLGVSGERSIGFACAKRLAELGATVAISTRPSRREAIAPLAGQHRLLLLEAEADDDRSITSAFARLGQSFQRLDFLVHTFMHVDAATVRKPLVEVTRAELDGVMGVGAYSLIAACRAALPLFERSASPRVVALTSACSHRPAPHYHAAGIAKAALESTVAYLAHELGGRGILCNAVSFTFVATDGATALVGEKGAAFTRAHQAKRAPTGRAVEPDEVADAVAWLSSAHARNLTGEILTVDGGYGKSYL